MLTSEQAGIAVKSRRIPGQVFQESPSSAQESAKGWVLVMAMASTQAAAQGTPPTAEDALRKAIVARLLPAGATVAGRDSHTLRDGAFARRTVKMG